MPKFSPSSRYHGLIQTKLTPYVQSQKNVLRDYLTKDVVATKSSINIVTVVGAAGSGKSSVLGQLYQKVQAMGWKSCWLSLNKDDDDVVAFLSYFTAALSTIDEKLGKRAYQMLGTRLARDPDVMFQTLSEDISEIQTPCAIFLDDLHYLSIESINKGLSYFISALPINVKFIVATRASPDLHLSRQKIQGTLLEINQDTLKFSESEIIKFFENLHDVSLAKNEIQRLADSTEGWAAGLQLAALSFQREPKNKSQLINKISGANKNIANYLMDSVLNGEEKEVQHFLLHTAQLGRMNSDLCRSVSGYEQSKEMLDYLREQNLFIIELDLEGVWFRYHHLFAEFLVAELKHRNKNAYRDISYAASQWFLKQNLYTEAIQHLLSAERFHDAAKLIADKGERVAQYEGDHSTMLDWIRRLPVAYHNQHPAILLNHAWSLIFTRSSKEALLLVEKVRNQLDEYSKNDWNLNCVDIDKTRCLTDVIEAVAFASEDKSQEALLCSENALKKWPQATPFQLGALYNVLAYSSIANFDFEKGLEAATQARIMGWKVEAEYVIVWADWISAILCLKRGSLIEAEMHLMREWNNPSKLINQMSHASILRSVLLAEILLDRGDAIAAQENISDLKQIISVLVSKEPLLILQRTIARLKAFQGESHEAIHYLRDCEEVSLASDTPRIAMLLAAEALKIHLRQDNLQGAEEINDRWGLLSKGKLQHLAVKKEVSKQIKSIMRIRLYMIQKEYGVALKESRFLLKSANLLGRGRLQIELTVLIAICLWQLDRENESLRTLAKATSLATLEGFAAPFLESHNIIRVMFENLLSNRRKIGLSQQTETIIFEKQLLELLSDKKSNHFKSESNTTAKTDKASNSIVYDSLTHREIEILNLAAEGMSNGQTAETLFVSLSTVKWHLHNIYSKLDVKNRMAAVAKAKQLNILP